MSTWNEICEHGHLVDQCDSCNVAPPAPRTCACVHGLAKEYNCAVCDTPPAPNEQQELAGVLEDIQNFLDGTRLGDSDCLLLGDHDAKLLLSALTSAEARLEKARALAKQSD